MDNKRALSGIPKLWISMQIDLVGEHSNSTEGVASAMLEQLEKQM